MNSLFMGSWFPNKESRKPGMQERKKSLGEGEEAGLGHHYLNLNPMLNILRAYP